MHAVQTANVDRLDVGCLGTAWAATSNAIQAVPADIDTIIEVMDDTCKVATASTRLPSVTRKGMAELLSMSYTPLGAPRTPNISWPNLRKALSSQTSAVTKAMLRDSPGPEAIAKPIDATQEDRHMLGITDEHMLTLVAVTLKPRVSYFDVTTRVENHDGSSTTMSFGNYVNKNVDFSGDQVVTFEGKAFNVHVMKFKTGVPYSIYVAGSTYDGQLVHQKLCGRSVEELMVVYMILTPPGQRTAEYNENAILLCTSMSDCVTKVHEAAMNSAAHLHLFQIRFSKMMHKQYCVTGRGVVHPALPRGALKTCTPDNIPANALAMEMQAQMTDPGRRPLHAQFGGTGGCLASVAFRQHRAGPDKVGAVVTITEVGVQLMTEVGHVTKCHLNIPAQLATMPCLSLFAEIQQGITVGHMFPSSKMMSSLGIPPVESVLLLMSCYPGAHFERKSAEGLVQQGNRLGVEGVRDCARDVDLLGQPIRSIANLSSVRRLDDTRIKAAAFEISHCPYQLIVNLLDHACQMPGSEWSSERDEISKDMLFGINMCKALEGIGISAMSDVVSAADITARMHELQDLNPIAKPLSPAVFMPALLRLMTGVRPLVRKGAYLNSQLLQIRNGLQIVFRVFAEAATTKPHVYDGGLCVAEDFCLPVGALALKKLSTLVAFADGEVLQPFHCGDEGQKIEISGPIVRIAGASRHMLLDAPPLVGMVSKVTETEVHIETADGCTVLQLPDYSNALVLDSGALDEGLLCSHVARSYKGTVTHNIKKKIYDEQQQHSASDFVDTATKKNVKTAQMKMSGALSLMTVRLPLEWDVVSSLHAEEAMSHIHSSDVSVLQKEFASRQPCLESRCIHLPVVSVSAQLSDIIHRIDGDWNKGVHTVVEGMPKDSKSLLRSGILAAIAMHPGLPAYAQRSVGFMALSMLASCGSPAVSALEALLQDPESMTPKHSRSLMAFACENAPFDAYVFILMRLSATMQGSKTDLKDTLEKIRKYSEDDVTRCNNELMRLHAKLPSAGAAFGADLCLNCNQAIIGGDMLKSARLCQVRSSKTVVDWSVMCTHANCVTWCCPSTMVGDKCPVHAWVDIERGHDEVKLWRSWLSQGKMAGIVPGSIITMFTFDEPKNLQHLASMAVVTAICNGHAQLCYIDNCVPNAPSYVEQTASDVREMITTGNFPQQHIDMNMAMPEEYKSGGYWRLGRKKMQQAVSASRGRISIREFDDILLIFGSATVSPRATYAERMAVRMVVNRATFTRLHGAQKDRLPLVSVSLPAPVTDTKLKSATDEAGKNLKSAINRRDYVAIATSQKMPVMPPQECTYLCPITGQPCQDPVITADGHTYDREAITQWFESNMTSPLTGLALRDMTLIPNYALK